MADSRDTPHDTNTGGRAQEGVSRPPAPIDDARIRRYLLLLLPEPEAEVLEEAYVVDPEMLDRVRDVEHDLLDDYVAGRLGEGDRAHFERRYLTAPRLQERVALARALRSAAGPGAGARAALGQRAAWRGPAALAAAVVLGVVGVSVWKWRDTTPEALATPPATTVAQAEPSPPSKAVDGAPAPRPAAAPLVVALSPSLLRGAEGRRDLSIPAGTAAVVLELEGDPGSLVGASRLQATLATVEGAPVWVGPAQRAGRRGRPALLASVSVPAVTMAPGDYLVSLADPDAPDEPLQRYFLRVSGRPRHEK
jgi:hypothetical protein